MSALAHTAEELDVLGRTLFGEARGEGSEGLAGVAWVVRNRVEADLHHDNRPDWWGEGILGCARNPRQFNCWGSFTEHDKRNLAALLKVTTADRSFARCLEVARGVLAGTIPDPTGRADSYVRTDWIARTKWASDNPAKLTRAIGAHSFFHLEDW